MIYGRFNFPIGNFNMGNTFNYFSAFRSMNYTYPFFQFNNVRLPFYVPTHFLVTNLIILQQQLIIQS